MQPQEFEQLCESIYGTYWKRPVSRALGRDAKMMPRYASGDTVIPADVAQRLRSIADIGRAGEIVKQVIIAFAAKPAGGSYRRSSQQQAHELAAQIVSALRRHNLLVHEDE
jgi:hypothetical protein